MIWIAVALAESPEVGAETAVPTVSAADGIEAFSHVYKVLTSPRCLNCHPNSDVPLVSDSSTPHAMNITRKSPELGLPCSTCHRETGLDLPNVPPSSPHWGLPPRIQAFAERTEPQLCKQLNNPETTGGRDLAALLHHVEHDALVLYGWSPGGGRTTPPISHQDFVRAFTTWVGSGGACPE